MDTRTGKKLRMGRLFNQNSQKTILVAYSHASFMGPLPGMRTREELTRTARALRTADGIMLSPGLVELLEDAFIGKDAPALVIQIDWQNYSRKTLAVAGGAAGALTTVEQAAAADAAAVMSYLYLGFDDPRLERDEVARNAALVRECERSGLLLMIEPRSAREKTHPGDKTDVEIMAMYARISAEIGADLVKVIDPGSDEGLAEIAAGCPAPVLLAGGAQKESFDEALRRAEAAMRAGWAGLVFGRNVFQHPDPPAALAALRKIVHNA